MAYNSGSIASTATIPAQITLLKPASDTMAFIQISGTYGTAVFKIEGTIDSTNWFDLASVRSDTLVTVNGGTTTQPTDNATLVMKVPAEMCVGVRANLQSLASGTARFDIWSSSFVGEFLSVSTTTNANAVLAQTITSTAANAFAVGANGTTNPSLKVDASTASAATGLALKSAAAGAGVDLAAISSGSNEVLTVEAKGTSALKLNSTTACTGAVQIGGAASGNNATGLVVTPAAAASGVAVAAVSTGSNEKLTVDAKGSGVIVIGGTSTGIISLGRGSVSTAVFSGTKTSVATQNSTPTAAQLLGGYIAHASTTGGGTATLDTAANIDTAIPTVATGDMFECLYANTGTQTVTITTNTGLSLKGTVAIPSGKNAVLEFFRTGAGAWDVIITVSA